MSDETEKTETKPEKKASQGSVTLTIPYTGKEGYAETLAITGDSFGKVQAVRDLVLEFFSENDAKPRSYSSGFSKGGFKKGGDAPDLPAKNCPSCGDKMKAVHSSKKKKDYYRCDDCDVWLDAKKKKSDDEDDE